MSEIEYTIKFNRESSPQIEFCRNGERFDPYKISVPPIQDAIIDLLDVVARHGLNFSQINLDSIEVKVVTE